MAPFEVQRSARHTPPRARPAAAYSVELSSTRDRKPTPEPSKGRRPKSHREPRFRSAPNHAPGQIPNHASGQIPNHASGQIANGQGPVRWNHWTVLARSDHVLELRGEGEPGEAGRRLVCREEESQGVAAWSRVENPRGDSPPGESPRCSLGTIRSRPGIERRGRTRRGRAPACLSRGGVCRKSPR